MAEWTRASEVLSEEEWEQLDELPPSAFKRARRRVAGHPGRTSRAGKRLPKARRILQKQAAGEFPLPGGSLEQWTHLLRLVDELLGVARRPRAEGQSHRDWWETNREALTRAHVMVQALTELCPTTEELLEARGIQIHGEAIE